MIELPQAFGCAAVEASTLRPPTHGTLRRNRADGSATSPRPFAAAPTGRAVDSVAHRGPGDRRPPSYFRTTWNPIRFSRETKDQRTALHSSVNETGSSSDVATTRPTRVGSGDRASTSCRTEPNAYR